MHHFSTNAGWYRGFVTQSTVTWVSILIPSTFHQSLYCFSHGIIRITIILKWMDLWTLVFSVRLETKIRRSKCSSLSCACDSWWHHGTADWPSPLRFAEVERGVNSSLARYISGSAGVSRRSASDRHWDPERGTFTAAEYKTYCHRS